jgi:meso-butanediol dehydrogenase / (S,S)-butanediol dehydrogenase / diacetyl reductase
MAERFKGKVAIVTGGARGIGRRIASALIHEGVQVAVLSRPSTELQATVDSLGPSCMAVECDISNPDAVREAYRQVIGRFGRLDFLINNAAACLLNRIEKAKDHDVLREVSTNFLGPIWCIRDAVPHMRAAGGGHVVNISSDSVLAPVPFLAIYAATKGGLETLSLGLAGELARHRIKVSVLRCGQVKESNISKSWDATERAAFFEELVASGRMPANYAQMEPETVAENVVHILGLPPSANVQFFDMKPF